MRFSRCDNGTCACHGIPKTSTAPPPDWSGHPDWFRIDNTRTRIEPVTLSSGVREGGGATSSPPPSLVFRCWKCEVDMKHGFHDNGTPNE